MIDSPVFTASIKRYGFDQPLVEQRILRAGPLTLVLEGGDLRYIRLGAHEVLRRVYVAVRDPNWGTIPPVYSNVRLDIRSDSFDVSFDAEHSAGRIDFAWHGTLMGTADGVITYVMDGIARKTFHKNRIGFCILHPMSCAGAACTVLHVDGSTEEGAFPSEIAPHQPFLDMVAITHNVSPGLRAEVRSRGDIFEMEDQRNWTDASYKTYSTPTRIPFPVEVQEGTRISQSFALSLHGSISVSQTSDDGAVEVTIDPGATYVLPRIGLGVASHRRPLNGTEQERLRALHLAHLRVDLDLAREYEAQLAQATRDAGALGIPLEAALFLSDAAETELAILANTLNRLKPRIARWLVFHKGEKSTTERWVRLARGALGAYGSDTLFGAGTNAYFTELNRARPPVEAIDGACYSINPQVHAFDNASLTETLAAQAATLDSARRFCGGKPLAVSPVTLKPRFNPDATSPEPELLPGELPPQVDPRQMSLFGAGWTLGSIKYLAEGGAASATYYETSGWCGVMETGDGSPLPDRFRSFPGMLFPLYHVLADVGELADATVLRCQTSQPLQVDGLALRAGQRIRVLLANLANEPCDVRVQNLPVQTVHVRHLDESSFEQATYDGAAFRGDLGAVQRVDGGTLHLHLLPYAVVRIDGEGGAS